MTASTLAAEMGLWTDIRATVNRLAAEQAERLLDCLATLPVRRSRASLSLGCYVSRAGHPVCIRLQFNQETECLKQTLLHEIAHVCDHLTRQHGERYRQAHGPNWQFWAEALGTTRARRGESEALQRLYRQRVKPVAVCSRCGTVLHRVRRLNRRRSYLHVNCGGRLRPL